MWECRKWRNVHRFDIFSMRSSPQFLNRTNYFGFCRCSGLDSFPMPSNGDFGFVMQKVFLVSFVGLLDFSHGTTNYGIRLPSKWLEKLNRFRTAKNFMDAYTQGTEIVHRNVLRFRMHYVCHVCISGFNRVDFTKWCTLYVPCAL